jgi:bifunctional ADP-heptose synthase (sugar kinase/adenylyltransferase)
VVFFLSKKKRPYMLATLEVVDGIFVFDGDRLSDEILRFRPDIYVKSGDYKLDNLVPSGHKALVSVGAEIKFVPFVPGFSTTSTIRKIRGN